MKAIAIDSSALDRIQSGLDFDIEWFNTWASKNLPQDIKRVEIDGLIYLLGPKADFDSKLLIIDLEKSGLFSTLAAKHRPEAFLRLVRLGRAANNPGKLLIPMSWAPYHAESLISIRSNNSGSGEHSRIEMDINPQGSKHLLVFNIDSSKRDLHHVEIDYENFNSLFNSLDAAIIESLNSTPSEENEDKTRIVLTEFEDRVSLGRSLDEWVNGKLTKAQQEFLRAPINKSIRLVGPAGTGKTLSLAIRCLLESKNWADEQGEFRSLFLTHNQSTVEIVSNALSTLDRENNLNRISKSTLKICTLQELANEAMKYDLHGLEPLSNDGLEGRLLQMEAIESILDQVKKSDWITYRDFSSDSFRELVEQPKGSPQSRSFCFEIMNEFACVLEADGVRQSAERRERYLSEQRKSWMFPLPNREDRQFLLQIYDRFRVFLRDLGVIGVDQMISDYLGYLDSNRWDNIRNREGYDIVFVDELHLFNRQERMTLHHLMRDYTCPPRIVMAYDSKQSVRDTFYGLQETTNGSTVFARDMRLGDTQRFELSEGFRYTPEIGRVLEWIDQTFPAAGISEELGVDWSPISLSKNNPSGDRPLLAKARRTLDIFHTVFPRAKKAAIEQKKGRRVAVLCVSEQLFKRYADAGQYSDFFIPITDREQLSGLRHAGKRFVLSMPEYVAGVQFDTVFLIEVNDGEVPTGPYATGSLRRFISQIYLGASRAERVLEIYSNEERGGPSRALRHALDEGAIDAVDINDIN